MTETAKTPPKQLTPWKPGQSGNPNGRPKGARNKLGEDFLKALSEDFDAHGVAALAKVREDDPGTYVKVIASLLPKDVNLTHNASEAFAQLLEAMNAGSFAALADRLRDEPEQPTDIRH